MAIFNSKLLNYQRVHIFIAHTRNFYTIQTAHTLATCGDQSMKKNDSQGLERIAVTTSKIQKRLKMLFSCGCYPLVMTNTLLLKILKPWPIESSLIYRT